MLRLKVYSRFSCFRIRGFRKGCDPGGDFGGDEGVGGESE